MLKILHQPTRFTLSGLIIAQKCVVTSSQVHQPTPPLSEAVVPPPPFPSVVAHLVAMGMAGAVAPTAAE